MTITISIIMNVMLILITDKWYSYSVMPHGDSDSDTDTNSDTDTDESDDEHYGDSIFGNICGDNKKNLSTICEYEDFEELDWNLLAVKIGKKTSEEESVFY